MYLRMIICRPDIAPSIHSLAGGSLMTKLGQVCVVIPNWNGKDSLRGCLDSLLAQSLKAHIIVVDNAHKLRALRTKWWKVTNRHN